MKSKRYLIYIVLAMVMASPMYAVSGRAEFDAAEFDSKVQLTLAKLNREAAVDTESAMRLAGLLQSEYGTSIEEMKWAVENSLSWGEISAFAYIGTTTGRSFQAISSAHAQRDLWDYTEKAGMNS